MTLYVIIMGQVGKFTKMDWSELGKGKVTDKDTIKQMLMEGYEAIEDDE